MPTYEEQVRRRMEQEAISQQRCPVEEDIDGAFSRIDKVAGDAKVGKFKRGRIVSARKLSKNKNTKA